MKHLSLLTVLMFSSSMVNAGWNYYPRIDDIPKGDCLEMICDFGCAEDSQGQGRCCPKPENYSENEEGNCVEDIIEDGCLKKKKKECLPGQYCNTFSKTCKTIPTCNECQKFDMQTGGFVPDTTKNNRQIQDACHVCQNGQVSLKDSSKTIPCGTQCCSSNQLCNPSNNTCYSCPYKVGEIVYSKKTAGSATFNPECSGRYEVVAIGGGGGHSTLRNGGSTNHGSVAGGGAAGSAKGILNVSIGDSFRVTVGVGGAGKDGGTKAGDGGTTTVGSFITCYGGKGGDAESSGGSGNKVGAGGRANATTPLTGIETFTGQSGAIASGWHSGGLSEISGASVGVGNYSRAGYSTPFCGGWWCDAGSSKTYACGARGIGCETGTGKPGYVHFKYLGK